MRQAITTRYLGATNFRGARIVARAYAQRIIVSWDHELDVEANHTAAAMQLVRLLGWHSRWVGGALPSGDGYVFVDYWGSKAGAMDVTEGK